LIWIISASLGWEAFAAFSIGEIIGFIMLVVGTLMYNEIIIFPCKIFSYYTKREIKKRKGGTDALDDPSLPAGAGAATYMSASPTAKYDHGRNYRNISKKADERNKLLLEHRGPGGN